VDLPLPGPGETIIGKTPDVDRATDLVRELLQVMGHDTDREGLARTPVRVATFYREFITRRPLCPLTTFDAEGTDEMVVVRAVPFYSLCEHHLLPFFGTATVGYVPDTRIIGLSKIPRVVQHFARGLQNQERLAQQIADCVIDTLRPKGVGVILHARHLCMEMRGIQVAGAVTTTSALRGVFIHDARCRREFLDFDAKNGH
jgi:GTP cyclohydrolase I